MSDTQQTIESSESQPPTEPQAEPLELPFMQDGEDPLVDQLKAMLESAGGRKTGAAMRRHVGLLLTRQAELQKRLARSEVERARAVSVAEQVTQPPLNPAWIAGPAGEGQYEVLTPGRRQVMRAHPDIEAARLRAGAEVLLDTEMKCIVRVRDEQIGGGAIGTVSEVEGERVHVRAAGDEETALVCEPQLAAELEPGDRVTYLREVGVVLARLPRRDGSRFALAEPPTIGFGEIGGLEEPIRRIKRDLDLHLIHREAVADYRLNLMRGLLLVGPPGVGKTMVAEATARYLAELDPDVRFLNVPPGALRGSFYGESEARIRELFGTARAATGLVVMFFDEIDTFGTRGAGAGNGIDTRVLAALLAEIQGLGSASNVLCIGATNRLDLCDAALVRPGRFGDGIYTIRRPDRLATREILRRHLSPDLPYADDGQTDATLLVDAATSYLHAAQGGAAALATATFANGSHREIRAGDVLSGALIAAAVESAKHAAAARSLTGEGGLALEDLLAALDAALATEADKLSAPQAAREVLDVPRASEIVRVDLPASRLAAGHRAIRAA